MGSPNSEAMPPTQGQGLGKDSRGDARYAGLIQGLQGDFDALPILPITMKPCAATCTSPKCREAHAKTGSVTNHQAVRARTWNSSSYSSTIPLRPKHPFFMLPIVRIFHPAFGVWPTVRMNGVPLGLAPPCGQGDDFFVQILPNTVLNHLGAGSNGTTCFGWQRRQQGSKSQILPLLQEGSASEKASSQSNMSCRFGWKAGKHTLEFPQTLADEILRQRTNRTSDLQQPLFPNLYIHKRMKQK